MSMTDQQRATGEPAPDESASGTSLPKQSQQADSLMVPADVAQTSAGTPSSRWRLWLLLGVATVLMVAGLFLWQQARGDDAIARSEERDTVLITARRHIETMNTLDYRKVDQGLTAWAAVSTGKLKDSLTQVSAEEKKLLADQKKVSVGKVIDAAVIDLDDTSATVIAAVEVTVKDDAKPAAEPTVKRNRFSARLVRSGADWKIEDLQQVAVNLS